MDKSTLNAKIFLIRGLAREIRHWGEFLPKLAQAFPQATLHPLEIPGSGKLRHLRAPLSMENYVEALRHEYLSQCGSEDNIVLGLSFGGMIAAQWITEYPTDFSAAILINSSFSNAPLFKRILPGGALQLIRSAFASNAYRQEKRIMRLLCNMADYDHITQQWAEIRRGSPVHISNFLAQLYAAKTWKTRAKAEIPTLVLCSKNDRLVSPRCSESISSFWQKEILYHDHAGHDLTTDDPDWCVHQLLSWLNSKPSLN